MARVVFALVVLFLFGASFTLADDDSAVRDVIVSSLSSRPRPRHFYLIFDTAFACG